METLNPFHVALGATADVLWPLGPKARLEVYARARAKVAEAAEATADPKEARELRLQARKLEAGIRAVEADIRSGVISPPGSNPSAAPSRQAPNKTDPETLFPLETIDPIKPPRDAFAFLTARARRIQALAWRAARLTAAGGPLSYAWILIEAAVPILFVTLFYTMLGRTQIFDMPTPTFVVVGIGAWFVYRAIFVRISSGHRADAQLLRLPVVSDFDLTASKTLFLALLYGIMIFGLLGVLGLFGLAGPPARPLEMIFLLLCLVALGFSHGVAYDLMMQRFPPLLRVRMILLRAFYVLSGAMYVTEQFPEQITRYLLWNPFLHCIQLVRAAYFEQYESRHASMAYVVGFVLVSLAFGLACQRAAPRRPGPV